MDAYKLSVTLNRGAFIGFNPCCLTVNVRYNNIIYSKVLTISPQITPTIYQLNPEKSSLSFSYVDGSYQPSDGIRLTCGVTATSASGTIDYPADNSYEYGINDSVYYILYSTNGTDYSRLNGGVTIIPDPTKTIKEVILKLTDGNNVIDKENIVVYGSIKNI